MKKLILLGCFLLIVIQLQIAAAAELIVGDSRASYQSIQAAVNAAVDGDTLLLNPGVLDSTEDLNIDCG